jgi:hypothetical protein
MKLEQANAMTVQQLCDYAMEKIVKQGKQCLIPSSVTEMKVCAYSDGAGNHCAVGWLLDEDDSALMGAKGGVWCLVESSLVRNIPEAIKTHIELFLLLQSFHDDKTRDGRQAKLFRLWQYIDTKTNPAYQQWVGMGKD